MLEGSNSVQGYRGSWHGWLYPERSQGCVSVKSVVVDQLAGGKMSRSWTLKDGLGDDAAAWVVGSAA
jgi:hypothetical protein